MINKKIIFLGAPLFLLILITAGCDMHSTSLFYSRDIFDVSAGTVKEPMKIKSTFLIEVPSSDDKYKSQVLDYLDGILVDPKFVGWTQENLTTFAKIEAATYMTKSPENGVVNEKHLKGKGLLSYWVGQVESPIFGSDDWHFVTMTLNKMALEKLNARVKAKTYTSVKFESAKLKLELSNDLREDIQFLVLADSYIDSKPYIATEVKTADLKPREDVSIELSNVFSSSLKSEGFRRVFNIRKK